MPTLTSAGITFSTPTPRPSRRTGERYRPLGTSLVRPPEEAVPTRPPSDDLDTIIGGDPFPEEDIPSPSIGRSQPVRTSDTVVPIVPVRLPEELTPCPIELHETVPSDLGRDACPTTPRPVRRPGSVNLAGVTASAPAVRSCGFDSANIPGGLPLTPSEMYVSPAFREKLIARINYVNRLYHTLYGMPFYSSEGTAPTDKPAMTEEAVRLVRAINAHRDFTGSARESGALALLLYCISQQEDPEMFSRFAQEQGFEDTWEATLNGWYGKSALKGPLHPFLNGMMVVPQRPCGSGYPVCRSGGGLPEIHVRPTLILNGGVRAFLNLGKEKLEELEPSLNRRYRGAYLTSDAHSSRDNCLQAFSSGSGFDHRMLFCLATPGMVSHFWSRFTPMVRAANGNEISDYFLSTLEGLGLLSDYLSQDPVPLWHGSPLSYRTLWNTNLRIPIPDAPR